MIFFIPDVESIAWGVGKFDGLVCLARVDVKWTTRCLLANVSFAPPEEVALNAAKSASLFLDKRWRNCRSVSRVVWKLTLLPVGSGACGTSAVTLGVQMGCMESVPPAGFIFQSIDFQEWKCSRNVHLNVSPLKNAYNIKPDLLTAKLSSTRIKRNLTTLMSGSEFGDTVLGLKHTVLPAPITIRKSLPRFSDPKNDCVANSPDNTSASGQKQRANIIGTFACFIVGLPDQTEHLLLMLGFYWPQQSLPTNHLLHLFYYSIVIHEHEGTGNTYLKILK